MSFEKDFPELVKGLGIIRTERLRQRNEIDFLMESIQLHCLDKQKVKEAIMKQINKRPSGNPEVDAYINGIQLMEDLEIRK